MWYLLVPNAILSLNYFAVSRSYHMYALKVAVLTHKRAVTHVRRQKVAVPNFESLCILAVVYSYGGICHTATPLKACVLIREGLFTL